MNLFTENCSLDSMNEKISNQLPKYNLIGDLPISNKDYYQLASSISNEYKNYKYIFYKNEESLVAFLVFYAVYEFDNRNFWKPLEKYVGELTSQRRVDMYAHFKSVVTKWELDSFENESEDGYTYVTPILCHAGIPVNAFESYFSAISNTVDDVFYDNYDVDDYLIYLENKTEMPVKRYLRLSNKRDSFNFIQNTKQLLSGDSFGSVEEQNNGNCKRMMEQISLWKEKPKNKLNLQARSNVQLNAPKIKIDLDGVGIYCELPPIIVKECYDSYLTWEIESDDISNIIQVNFYRRGETLISDEKIISLSPAALYTITLKIDDKQISKWEFDGTRNNYVAFTQNGNLIRTKYLPDSPVILLINNNHKILEKESLPILELPQIPLWSSYQVYNVDLANLKVLNCSKFNIQVNSNSKPFIEGGALLFNQKNSNVYMTLPYIKIPKINDGDWQFEVKHLVANEVYSKTIHDVESNCEKISLSAYINDEAYGKYDIKIWNHNGSNAKLSIEYVPFAILKNDGNDFWPTYYNGYQNCTQMIQTTKNVEIEIYNVENCTKIQHDECNTYRFKVNEKERFLIGEYKYSYNEYQFSTQIKKSIQPISWGIIGLEKNIVNLSSMVYKLTLLDLMNTTDPYLLFEFNFDTIYEIQTIEIDLVGPNENNIQSITKTILNKDGLCVSLNPFMFEVQNSNDVIDFHLRVSLYNSTNNFVTSFIIARFQEEVIIEDANFAVLENEIAFTWKEQGICSGRELILYNFLRPWRKPYNFPLEDKICDKTINTQCLEDGIYYYLIQKEPDNLFDEVKEDVCSLTDFQKRRIRILKEEKNFSSDIEKVLYRLIRSRFLKSEKVPNYLESIKSQVSQISIRFPEDIHMLSNAYILHERFYMDKEDASEVINIFASLFDLYSGYRNETFKMILESDFSTEYKKKLMHQFYCNNLLSTIEISDFELKLLAEIDEDMAGLVNLLQNNNNNMWLNWAGISGIDVLVEEDIFGDKDINSTIFSEKNLGKSSYILDYFHYVADNLHRPKNALKTSGEFLREFQKNQTVEETHIFGKSRLQLVVEWKEKNCDVELIQENLSLILNAPFDNKLKEDYKDAFFAISKRKIEDELGYYVGLIALNASFVRHGLAEETRHFNRMLNFTIEKCGKLYYRDAIIIELYMRERSGTYGVESNSNYAKN